MKHCCEVSLEQLIDYADGVPKVTESERIKKHIANCPQCKETIDLLQRSMQAIIAVWQSNYESRKVSANVRMQKRRWLQTAAACLLVAVGLSMFFLLKNAKNGSQLWSEIEKGFEGSRQAAEIMAATEILNNSGMNKTIGMEQYRYVAKVYGNTEAGKKAKEILLNN